MRWLIVLSLVVLAVVIIMKKGNIIDGRGASPERMKKLRAAKAKKRRDKITYTPPTKSEGGIMKVA